VAIPYPTLRCVDRARLARECAKLDPDEERAIAEEAVAAEALNDTLNGLDEFIGE